jgi:hypothetical protein
MEPMLEAVARLRSTGFTHDVTAVPGGRLRCSACGEIGEAGDVTLSETARFEGDSNPDDQSILVALTATCGHRALYSSAYGPSTPGTDAEVHRALAAATADADMSL